MEISKADPLTDVECEVAVTDLLQPTDATEMKPVTTELLSALVDGCCDLKSSPPSFCEQEVHDGGTIDVSVVVELDENGVYSTPSSMATTTIAMLDTGTSSNANEVYDVSDKSTFDVDQIQQQSSSDHENNGGNLTALTSSPKRRRRNVLTLQQKLDVIRRVKEGEKVTRLAAEYGVGKATVSELKHQEEKINAFVSKMYESGVDGSTARRTMMKPQEELVERALRLWLKREAAKGSLVTGPVLMQMAKTFHRQLCGDSGSSNNGSSSSFKASTGWLQRFKTRNGITHFRTVPKTAKFEAPALVETQDDVQTQLDLLRCFVRDKSIDADRVYTVDKMQLHWRALPLKGSSSAATAAAMDRIEVLVCMNVTGTHRFRVALIVRGKGNAINDSICDDLNASALPFRRYSCAQTFDAGAFAEWFREEFVAAVSSTSRPALLLVGAFWLDGNSTLQTDDGNIRCVVLSSATVFVTQSANQYLLERLRCGYRKALLSRVLFTHQLQQHPGLAINSSSLSACRSVTLKDAGYMLNETWLTLRVDPLIPFWRDTFRCVGLIDTTIAENAEVEDKKPDGCSSTSQLDVSALNVTSFLSEASEIAASLKDVFSDEVSLDRVTNWLLMDASQHADDLPAQGSVVDVVKKGENGIDSSSRYSLRGSVPNDAEAHACLVKGLAWLERQPDADTKDLQTLWKLQRISAVAAAASRRRKSDKT